MCNPGPPLTPRHSPAHVPPPAASKEFCVCQSRKSLNELVEAIVQSQWCVCVWIGGGEGVQREASSPRKRNFLLCKHPFHHCCMLPRSQTGVNTRESPDLSQSCCSLLCCSLLLLSLLFSVALNILSSFVTACPVCIPLSPHLFPLSEHFPSACWFTDVHAFIPVISVCPFGLFFFFFPLQSGPHLSLCAYLESIM